MLTDWILLGIFAAAVITCAVIIWRKLPTLAGIRIEATAKFQNEAKKQAILDQRLQQKLGTVEAAIARNAKRVFAKGMSGMQRLRQNLVKMEREYRRKVMAQKSLDDPLALRSRVATGLADAQAAYEREEYARAEQLYVDVVSLDPKNADAYLGLADVAMAQKNYPNAREALQFVLKLRSSSDGAYSRLGHIASEEGKLAEAEADLLQSVALNAKVACTQFDLGVVEEQLGNQDRAAAALREAVMLEPANPKYLDGILEYALRQQNRTLAEENLARLREANPENQKIEEFAERIAQLVNKADTKTTK